MKYAFFALAAFVCGSVFAGEPASVINAPAPAPVVIVEGRQPRPIVIMEGTPRRCVNGRCSTSSSAVCTGPNCQKYSVKDDATETVRKRWFGGGVVVRNNNRTVVKPVR